MNFIIKYAILTALAFFAKNIFVYKPESKSGIEVTTWTAALFFALVLALLNTFLYPIIKLLSLPLRILTLGLFSFVINGIMIKITSKMIDGYTVHDWLTAILFGTGMAIANSILSGILDSND